MRFSFATIITLVTLVVAAPTDELISRDGGKCPAVWSQISSYLTSQFKEADGTCNDNARAAIRFAFHDCATWSKDVSFFAPASGACDGSLALVDSEIGRPENGGLLDYKGFITSTWAKFNKQVSMADLVAYASHHAVISCPGGPQMKITVGRKDNGVTESTPGLMPAGFGPSAKADILIALFENKGFTPEDLAALVGAHSTSKNFAETQIPLNAPQDSTPGIWDVKYYSETYNPPAGVSRFESDINLSALNSTTGPFFQGFVNNQGKWASKFSDAMFRLTLLGIADADQKNFIDCTNTLPKTTSVPKRGFAKRAARN